MLVKGWGRNHCHGAPPVCTNLVPPQNTGASSDACDRGNDTHHHSEHRFMGVHAYLKAHVDRVYPTAHVDSVGQIVSMLPLLKQFTPEAT